MRTFKSIMSIAKDRTNPRAARRGQLVAGIGFAAVLAFAAGARHTTYAATSPTPLAGRCTDFACQP